MSKLKIVSAVDLFQNRWDFARPHPDRKDEKTLKYPTSVIHKMILVGNYVEVFGRYSDKPNDFLYQVLMPPTISLILAIASRVDWDELLREFTDEDVRLEEVLDIQNNLWKVGSPFPGDNNSTIAAMYMVEDRIEVFILPNVGSELDQSGIALHATLMPLTVQRTNCTAMTFAQWNRVMAEAQEAADDAERGEEEEEEEEEGEEVAAQPTAPYGRSPAMPGMSSIQAAIGAGQAVTPPMQPPATAPNGSVPPTNS